MGGGRWDSFLGGGVYLGLEVWLVELGVVRVGVWRVRVGGGVGCRVGIRYMFSGL